MIQWPLFSRGPLLCACIASVVMVTILVRIKRKRKVYELVGEVTALNVYPVKSCGPVSCDQAQCTPEGLRILNVSDRHFLIVDATGDYVTAHQAAQIAGIKSSVDQQELVLEFNNLPELRVPLNPQVDSAKIVPCSLYSTPFEAQDCGPEAGAWLSQVLQMEGLKLLVLPPSLKRRVGRCVRSTVKDQIAFSNRAPYLITTEESLADLNTWITPATEGEITMRNFRPSIVIRGTKAPWDEDNWTEIKIGNSIYMRVLQPCGRCPLTTVDVEKLQKREDGEPFKTLRRRRLFPAINATSPLFGVYVGLESRETIRVGDKVYAVRSSMHIAEVAK